MRPGFPINKFEISQTTQHHLSKGQSCFFHLLSHRSQWSISTSTARVVLRRSMGVVPWSGQKRQLSRASAQLSTSACKGIGSSQF
jgi:hypothetical protein